MPISFSKPFPLRILLVAVLALSGAVLYAQAQTPEETRRVADRALEMRRYNHRNEPRPDGMIASPNGDYVVVDLGDREFYNGNRRSQVVYDFANKKVFILRFNVGSNDIEIDSESLR